MKKFQVQGQVFVMAHLVVLILVLVALAGPFEAAPANKMVRVALRKATMMQGGPMSQPLTVYFARTEFGSPPKPFNMLVDLNGREVWLPHHSKMGIVYMRLKYKNGYSKKDSITSVKEPCEIYKIDYLGTELSGKAYRDVVELKDIVESSQPVIFEQRFLAISSASNDKIGKYKEVDGVLAFNPWPLSETGSDMVAVAMKRANLTSDLRFGLELNADLEGEDGGELTIGGINTHKYVGNLRYHQLLSQHAWEVGMQMVMLGANSMNACPNTQAGPNACTAVLSTTTNDIHGPSDSIRSLLKLLGVENMDKEFKESSVYEIDCLKVATAPTLTFVIDGAYYSIPPTSYIKKKIDGFIFKSSTCYIGLLSNLSNNRWELGTSFLSNFYTVFGIKNLSVAFGQRR